jgi:uncharacterized protein YjiS (DUF1127 family)
MTTIALSQLISGTPAFLTRLGQRFTALLDGISEARTMAETFKTLSRMSDAQLARHGLKREDIPQAVLDASRNR